MKQTSLLSCAMLLTACADPAPLVERVETRPVFLDEGLMVCPDHAPVPPDPVTERDIALWVIDLEAAHAVCLDSMNTIRARNAEMRAAHNGRLK